MTRAVTYLCLLFLFVLPLQAQDLAPGSTSASDTAVGRRFDASANTLPVSDKWWWSDEWYDSGQRPVPANHRVVESALSYINPEDDTEVPAVLFVRPDQKSFQPSCFSTGAAGLMISSSAWPGAWWHAVLLCSRPMSILHGSSDNGQSNICRRPKAT